MVINMFDKVHKMKNTITELESIKKKNQVELLLLKNY